MTEAYITGRFKSSNAPKWKKLIGLDHVHRSTVISQPGNRKKLYTGRDIYDPNNQKVLTIQHLQGEMADVMMTIYGSSDRILQQFFVKPGDNEVFTHPLIGEIKIRHTPLPER